MYICQRVSAVFCASTFPNRSQQAGDESVAQTLCVNKYLSHIIAEGLLRGPTWLNIIPDNADVFVSVGPCVFVPEPNHMTQLVHHDAKLVTVFPNGYGLGASSTTTHIRTAPMNEKKSNFTCQYMKKQVETKTQEEE